MSSPITSELVKVLIVIIPPAPGVGYLLLVGRAEKTPSTRSRRLSVMDWRSALRLSNMDPVTLPACAGNPIAFTKRHDYPVCEHPPVRLRISALNFPAHNPVSCLA